MKFQDVANMGLTGEYLSKLIDGFLDALIEKNNLKKPSEKEIQQLRKKVLDDLKEKYPSAGITLGKGD